MALPCLNCGKDVEANEAKIFVTAFVCGPCYLMAEHMYQRSRTELTNLLVMLKEGIRLALQEGRFDFPAGHEIPKEEVLRAIITLQEKADAHRASAGFGDSKDERGTDGGEKQTVRLLGNGGGK